MEIDAGVSMTLFSFVASSRFAKRAELQRLMISLFLNLDFHCRVSKMLSGVFIDNKSSHGSNRRDCVCPFTGETFATCSTGSASDVDRAVASSQLALCRWGTPDAGRERVKALTLFANLVDENHDNLVQTIIKDVGKPQMEADLEISQVAAAFRYFGEIADKIHGESIPIDSSHLGFTTLVPVGVVGVISPWNFSLQLMAWRACSALAAGCTIVWKPAEETLYSALALLPLIAQAFPPGVFNVIQGKGSTVGMALVNDVRVAKIAFTGRY